MDGSPWDMLERRRGISQISACSIRSGYHSPEPDALGDSYVILISRAYMCTEQYFRGWESRFPRSYACQGYDPASEDAVVLSAIWGHEGTID